MKEFVLYILYYDVCYYFLHRLLHTRFLYPIHKNHHKYNTKYYDYYTGHFLEIPFTSLGLGIAIYLYNLYIYQFILFMLTVILEMVGHHLCVILVKLIFLKHLL